VDAEAERDALLDAVARRSSAHAARDEARKRDRDIVAAAFDLALDRVQHAPRRGSALAPQSRAQCRCAGVVRRRSHADSARGAAPRGRTAGQFLREERTGASEFSGGSAMPDGKESATSGASKRYGSEYRRGVDLPNAGSTEKSSSSSVMVVGLLSIRDAEAVQASLSSRLRCLSGSGGLRVPAADCKSRVLASDHAISDGDVIEARAAHAQATRRVLLPRRRRSTLRAALRASRARRTATGEQAWARPQRTPPISSTRHGQNRESRPPGARDYGAPPSGAGARAGDGKAKGQGRETIAGTQPGHSPETISTTYSKHTTFSPEG
jgi:hypothetical protein